MKRKRKDNQTEKKRKKERKEETKKEREGQYETADKTMPSQHYTTSSHLFLLQDKGKLTNEDTALMIDGGLCSCQSDADVSIV